MQTELPQPADYYRPTRSRELRERADHLETWNFWLSLVCLLLIFPTAPLILVAPMSLIGLALFPVAPTLALLMVRSHLSPRVRRLEKEAAALEADHAARYGPLPDEVS